MHERPWKSNKIWTIEGHFSSSRKPSWFYWFYNYSISKLWRVVILLYFIRSTQQLFSNQTGYRKKKHTHSKLSCFRTVVAWTRTFFQKIHVRPRKKPMTCAAASYRPRRRANRIHLDYLHTTTSMYNNNIIVWALRRPDVLFFFYQVTRVGRY